MDGQEATAKERTVVLSESEVRAARHLLSRLLAGDDSAAVDLATPAPTMPAPDRTQLVLTRRAREEFENRRRRAKLFGSAMFGEAAWDMLLALYIDDSTGPRQTISSLLQLAGTSRTTAFRWLEFLESHGLVWREAHPTDRRIIRVSLTDKACKMLNAYFSEIVNLTY